MKHTKIEPTFDLEAIRSKNFEKNEENIKGDAYPCVVCGKGVPEPKFGVWCHGGSIDICVTREEGERLNSTDESAADMGIYPIGPECVKKHPALKPYLFKMGK